MIDVGDSLPALTLENQDGTPVELQSLKGGPVVLYFYPKDDTPGCTKEACGFRDDQSTLESLGAQVVGISPDTVASHRKFADKYELPFTLLADPDKQACEAFGVWKEKTMFGKTGMGVERSTFVVDADGIVRNIFRKVKVDGHIPAVLEAIRAIEGPV